MNFPIAQLKTTGSIKQTKIIPTQSKAPGAYPFGIFDQPVMIPIGKFMRKKGWIKEGDLKVDLG